MQFPLQLKFKILTFAPKISVIDASGKEVAFIRQKFFKLKEHVQVYSDSSRQTLLCDIQADRIIDFSAAYQMKLVDGTLIGSVRRKGFRSIWRANYEILAGNGVKDYEIHERNPFVKVMDSLLSEIPVVGFFTSLFLHPKYRVTNTAGEDVVILSKRAAFFERKFHVNLLQDVPDQDHLRIVLSLLMFTLLERNRG